MEYISFSVLLSETGSNQYKPGEADARSLHHKLKTEIMKTLNLKTAFIYLLFVVFGLNSRRTGIWRNTRYY